MADNEKASRIISPGARGAVFSGTPPSHNVAAGDVLWQSKAPANPEAPPPAHADAPVSTRLIFPLGRGLKARIA